MTPIDAEKVIHMTMGVEDLQRIPPAVADLKAAAERFVAGNPPPAGFEVRIAITDDDLGGPEPLPVGPS